MRQVSLGLRDGEAMQIIEDGRNALEILGVINMCLLVVDELYMHRFRV